MADKLQETFILLYQLKTITKFRTRENLESEGKLGLRERSGEGGGGGINVSENRSHSSSLRLWEETG